MLKTAVAVFMLVSRIGLGYSQEYPCNKSPDLKELCMELGSGTSSYAECAKQQFAKHSESCKSYMAVAKEKMRAGVYACNADMQKFCADIKHGKGVKCLKSHSEEISAGCKAFLSSLKTTPESCKGIAAGLDLARCTETCEGKSEPCIWKDESCKSDATNSMKQEKCIQASDVKVDPCAQYNEACKSDVNKFCKHIQRGEDRILNCLYEHGPELSDVCKAKCEDILDSNAPGLWWYELDIDMFCRNLPPLEPLEKCYDPDIDALVLSKNAQLKLDNMRKCLKSHEAEIAPFDGCKDILYGCEQIHRGHPCGGDVAKFCIGVLGLDRQESCLALHEEKVSAPCKRFFYERVDGAYRQIPEYGMIKAKACANEVNRFCANAQAPYECLEEHESELPSRCRRYIMPKKFKISNVISKNVKPDRKPFGK